MTNIIIAKTDDETFEITLTDSTSSTTHTVTITPEYRTKLGWREDEIEKLLEKSFTFLLKRESKESILQSFDLSVISKYFPEYEIHIHQSGNC